GAARAGGVGRRVRGAAGHQLHRPLRADRAAAAAAAPQRGAAGRHAVEHRRRARPHRLRRPALRADLRPLRQLCAIQAGLPDVRLRAAAPQRGGGLGHRQLRRAPGRGGHRTDPPRPGPGQRVRPQLGPRPRPVPLGRAGRVVDPVCRDRPRSATRKLLRAYRRWRASRTAGPGHCAGGRAGRRRRSAPVDADRASGRPRLRLREAAMPIVMPRIVASAIDAEPEEAGAALTGFALFFCIFSGYFMLRPVREAMGIAAGIDQLQWLFTATFAATVLVVPLFAWLSAHVPRSQFASWVYGVFCVNLAAFALAFHSAGESLWVARAFYVWISVYNLFVVSVTWSVMADVFDARQARRLFAFIAAGASVGGLAGPAAGALLVDTLGHAGLVLLGGLLLGVALALKRPLMRWRERGGAGRPGAVPAESTRRPVAGNPFSGLTRVLRSPYLLAVSGFVVLLAGVTTFLYFEQARLVATLFPDRDEQVRVFSVIDMVVQAGGVRVLLAGVPLLVCVGFVGLALASGFAMLAALMVVRRVGEHAFVRPGREMLFAPLDAESKYKAKAFIDTVVYRGGDAASAWVK